MGTTSTTSVSNQFQKYYSKDLLDTAVQLTVMDQFADKRPLPKNKGAKIISFFRRVRSQNNASGLVTNVQTLTEGAPISVFADSTLDRIDVSLIQYGEASKITDILSWTQMIDMMQQNRLLIAQDCALNTDDVTRNSIITATQTGVTLNQASGTTTEFIGKIYSQNLANFAAVNSASVSGAKAVATDFLRAVTQLVINRAPKFGDRYVAIIPPQVAYDLQNDPDWIDAANYGDPSRRFRGELKDMYGCRFVEQTNPFQEDATGTEGTFAVAASAANRTYRSIVVGRGAYGVSELSGQSPYSPRVIVVDTADKTDVLNQYMTMGWKAFYGASALNCPYGLTITSKSEFAAA